MRLLRGGQDANMEGIFLNMGLPCNLGLYCISFHCIIIERLYCYAIPVFFSFPERLELQTAQGKQNSRSRCTGCAGCAGCTGSCPKSPKYLPFFQLGMLIVSFSFPRWLTARYSLPIIILIIYGACPRLQRPLCSNLRLNLAVCMKAYSSYYTLHCELPFFQSFHSWEMRRVITLHFIKYGYYCYPAGDICSGQMKRGKLGPETENLIKWENELDGGGTGTKRVTVIEHHVKGRFSDVKSSLIFDFGASHLVLNKQDVFQCWAWSLMITC